MNTIYMVFGRMSAEYGQPEFVDAPNMAARRIASAPAGEMIARFGAVRSDRPFVVDGFIFTPYTTDSAITPESVPAYRQVGVAQVI